MFDNAAAFTGAGTQRHCRPEKGKGRLMDRISYAKQLLCSYLINRSTVDNFRYEMQLINGKLYSCGGNDCEDRIIGLIDAKDRLAARTARARADAARTERGLNSLFMWFVRAALRIRSRRAGISSVPRSTATKTRRSAGSRTSSALPTPHFPRPYILNLRATTLL